MKKVIYAALILLGLSTMASCKLFEGDDDSDVPNILGEWTVTTKRDYTNPSKAQEFASQIGTITFEPNGKVLFVSTTGKDLGSASYKYSEAKVLVSGIYKGELELSGCALQGGNCDHQSVLLETLSWTDKDDIAMTLVKIDIDF